MCSKCKLSKLEIEFVKNISKKDGLNHQCRICSRQQVRDSYYRNRKHYVGNSRRTRQKNMLMIRQIKESKICMDCGKKYPYYVMDFDHRNKDEKKFCISTHTGKRGRNVILAEIEKCDLVCSNCHRERSHQRKVLMDT